MNAAQPLPSPPVIDHVILICRGCRRERTFWPDAPLVGAGALIEWINTKATRCGCGALACDLKAHLKGKKP